MPLIIPPVQTTSLTPLECDFCAAIRQELLFYAVGRFMFRVEGKVVDSRAGAWGACEECVPAVNRRDADALIRRSNPKTLTQLAYSAGLMKGLITALLPEPPPIMTSIRLMPFDGRWVEYHGDKPANNEKNPYVSDN